MARIRSLGESFGRAIIRVPFRKQVLQLSQTSPRRGEAAKKQKLEIGARPCRSQEGERGEAILPANRLDLNYGRTFATHLAESYCL